MSYHRFIHTYSGRRFYPLAPDVALIDLVDIAHALSQICRYGGHTSRFYSVAEHSMHVAHMVGQHMPEAVPYGLLHDATEAYLGDVVRPLKELPEFDFYRRAEACLEAKIWERFGLEPPTDAIRAEVRRADRAVVYYEAREFLRGDSSWRGEPDNRYLFPMDMLTHAPPCTAEDFEDYARTCLPHV